MRQARGAADRAAIPEVALMAVADILYFGLLAGVMLASTILLLRQFLTGDLAGRCTTAGSAGARHSRARAPRHTRKTRVASGPRRRMRSRASGRSVSIAVLFGLPADFSRMRGLRPPRRREEKHRNSLRCRPSAACRLLPSPEESLF